MSFLKLYPIESEYNEFSQQLSSITPVVEILFDACIAHRTYSYDWLTLNDFAHTKSLV
jgi:hypothetical protein